MSDGSVRSIFEGKGHGYVNEAGIICMQSCFKCGRQNYAIAVATGRCAWCGYNPNGKSNRNASLDPSAYSHPDQFVQYVNHVGMRKILKETHGQIMACGRLWNIMKKRIDNNSYKLTLEEEKDRSQ